MVNPPSLFLKDRTCPKYHYKSIHYDDYVIVDSLLMNDGTPVERHEKSKIIVGEQNGYQLDAMMLSDGKAAYLERGLLVSNTKESVAKLTKYMLSSTCDYDWVRNLWADETGVTIEVRELVNYDILSRILEVAAQYYRRLDKREKDFYYRVKEAFPMDAVDLCKEYGLITYAKDDTRSAINHVDYRYAARGESPPFQVRDIRRFLNYALSMDKLLMELGELYRLYLAWSYIYCADYMAGSVLTNGKKGNENEVMNACLYYIEREGSRIPTQISLEINKETRQISEIMTCDCLIDAIKLQLVDIIKTGDAWLDGRSSMECARCGMKFIRFRKNATLCEHCRTNAEKVRAHRLKKKTIKEAQSNAEKTGKQ